MRRQLLGIWLLFFLCSSCAITTTQPPWTPEPPHKYGSSGTTTYTSIATVNRNGPQFGADIDARFNHGSPIEPLFTHAPYVGLGAEVDGVGQICNDCTKTTPCTSGGTGAFAMGVNGVWDCSSSGGGGGGTTITSGAGDFGSGTSQSGGVLTGAVAKINGVAVTGTPSSGYVPTATSSSAATWQAQSGGGGTPTYPIILLTTSTTLTAGYTKVNAASAALTETLPLASTVLGKAFIVQKTDTTANGVTISTTLPDTIVGSTGSKYIVSNEGYIVLVPTVSGRWDVTARRTDQKLYVSDFPGSDIGAQAMACLAAIPASPGSAFAIGGLCEMEQSNISSQTPISTPIVVGIGQALEIQPGEYECLTGSSTCIWDQTGGVLLGANHMHTTNGYGATIYAGPGQTAPLVRVADSTCAIDSTCSEWSHWAEVGYLTLNGSALSTSEVMDVEEPGEGTIVHDMNIRSGNTTADALRVGGSVAGFAGTFNIEAVNSRYGINVDLATSRLTLNQTSGDGNLSLINWNVSGESILNLIGIKAESFAAGVNEPFINIVGGSGKEGSLEASNLYTAGVSSSGACTAFQKSASAGGPLVQNCDLIKITGGGVGVELHNWAAQAFTYLIDDTSANGGSGKKITGVDVGITGQTFHYASQTGFSIVTQSDGNYNDGLSVFGAGLTVNGLWGPVTINPLIMPGTSPGTGPTYAVGGTGGSTAYSYACAAQAADGTIGPPTSFTSTGSVMNASLTATNFVYIYCPILPGTPNMCVYKTDNTHLLGCGDDFQDFSTGGSVEIYDHGQTPTVVSAVAANHTGDLTIAGGGNFNATGGPVPTITAGCTAGGSDVVVGNNTAGTITTGVTAATTCTMTFANGGFTNAPHCGLTDANASIAGGVLPSLDTVTATTMKFDFASGGSKKINYFCIGG